MLVDRGRAMGFRLGINYWPGRTAMRWWTDFDAAELSIDLARISDSGFDSIRIFLTWEAFQPAPHTVSPRMLDRLILVADLAAQAGLAVMATLFTGHMSGVNWIPPWALGGSDADQRFRVVSGGSVTRRELRNWFSDTEITDAQVLLASETAAALAGHPALWAWDLGNENSNCSTPPNHSSGRDWLQRITSAIRATDDTAAVTIGLHMEDLEQDRNLGPADAAAVCDFLTMHGYPIYASWARGSTDEHVLAYLTEVTRWLGGESDVLFSEFGLPTFRRGGQPIGELGSMLVEEREAAAYIDRALHAVRGASATGAMLWCHRDYSPAIWRAPPLDEATHERYFGLWRADGSPKPSVEAAAPHRGLELVTVADYRPWIDISPEEFYVDGGSHLPRLYRRYRASTMWSGD
jgi:endo-1,4-beta-mannosidase